MPRYSVINKRNGHTIHRTDDLKIAQALLLCCIYDCLIYDHRENKKVAQ